MSGFIFFAVIVFVVIPIIKNAAKAKPANKQTSKSPSGSRQQNWSQVQEILQQKIVEQSEQSGQSSAKRNAQGHSAARRNTRERMRTGDGDTQVFPDSHMARVRKRDQRDRSERNRIEAMLHSKKNTSIVREGNRGVENWGRRGDKSGGGGFLFLILLGLIAVLVISKVAPDAWPEIMRALNIK